ncbi:hypothetical protein QF035_000629 [Streptomyces umbrinus]|uniref:Uncharacterized protein n=1 Tax=Streptomyces umbrinus TaxID=67370 RepID=A0ABU0SIG3_9ACTN|nr:hypothetical protein [Streptomyces umbrinus]
MRKAMAYELREDTRRDVPAACLMLAAALEA